MFSPPERVSPQKLFQLVLICQNRENENWNQFASYKTKSYIKESSRMFLVSLSYNFSFGRKFKTTQRKVNNSDNESGVMSTGK